MKVFISADMEGIAGVSAREEVTKGEPDYAAAREQMTAEVAAACQGAWAAGATEIVVKDAHWTGRNLDPRAIPVPDGKRLRLVRGWSGHPFSMVQELDASFHSVLFVGYHSAAAKAGNPLSHTLSSRVLAAVKLNGELASEFLVFSYAASLVGVPVVFLAGDEALCREARRVNEGLVTVETFAGRGSSIVTLAPAESVHRIREGAEEAVSRRAGRVLPLPSSFDVRVTFRDHAEAYRKSFYPGARLVADFETAFETSDYFDVLRMLKFITL